MKKFWLTLIFGFSSVTVIAQTKTTYEYDRLNRLVKVTTPASVTTYTYDDLGNRTVKKTKVEATALTPVMADGAFRIYPNPAREWTTVVCSEDAVGQTLRLVNVDGKLVVEQKIESTSTILRLDGIATGVYIVTIDKDGHPGYTYKLIKQ